MRDSSLGVFQSRLSLIKLMQDHFEYKQGLPVLTNKKVSENIKQQMGERLGKVINMLDFIHRYYQQFQPKLVSTVERLDADARTKIKTLIDVSKWTVQKFSIVKNNIDKTHRQLNRACKDEEQALMQNVQSLVLNSSRKKYGGKEDQLLSLDPELSHTDKSKVITEFALKDMK